MDGLAIMCFFSFFSFLLVYCLCVFVLHPGLHYHLLLGDSRGFQQNHQQDGVDAEQQRA